MKYAIELFFDKETERKLMRIAEKIAEEGRSTGYLDWKTRPHVTLACFSDVDEAKCAGRLAAFARRHAAFPVSLGSVGMFVDTKTVFFSPVMTETLVSLLAPVVGISLLVVLPLCLCGHSVLGGFLPRPGTAEGTESGGVHGPAGKGRLPLLRRYPGAARREFRD